MTTKKVKRKTISWAALVNKLDPTRKERKTAYIFSNGRKFRER